ncbi:tetratricopeptide repeat-containing sensor histidine kinase [Dyadobacter bucti]|uniref:tetratricopeptide repeat-containing sensor histidine kinase n=1 Tax=Dyadobacter bucti TaxID=2572203 RepID=UPI0011099C48|nr:tetratricopeptide repeat-containing sensor histidine kinase [Dyadobacter bucti]
MQPITFFKTTALFLMILTGCPAFGQVDKIRELEKSLPAIKDSIQYVDAINKISLLFYERNVDSTFYYSLRAREIAQRMQYAKGIADATNNLGIVFDIKGNIQLALRYYNDAYNQYRAIGDSSNITQTLMNIASVYSVNGKHDKALANFEQAMSLGNRISHDSITALVIYNYILMYPQKFSDAEKERYIERAGSIARKYKDSLMELALQQVKADKLIADGHQAKGVALLEGTLASALDMELYYLSMDILIELGTIYLKKDPEKGLGLYTKALTISEQKGYRLYAIDICKKLYDYYAQRGENVAAFVYTRKLVRLYEQQAEIDNSSGIDYIEYAVKDEQLKSEKAKSAYNSNLLWLATAVCFLTILSVIFLLKNWIMSRKTNDVLKMQFRQLESTSEALEQTNQNYAKLIKVVAHDLRNPIGAINSLSRLLLEDDVSQEETREFLQLINDSSNSCINLITDLLETNFNLKESELQKEQISLPPFLQQTVKLLTFRAKEKDQELVLKEPLNKSALADRDKLLRVLNNLIINAIKFTPIGGRIEISTQRSPEGIIISVKDNGIGIPKEAAAKIFDPFTSSKREGTSGEQPFGLGLYIARQIVDAHQGRIWFDSEPGKGTTFSVLLPDMV